MCCQRGEVTQSEQNRFLTLHNSHVWLVGQRDFHLGSDVRFPRALATKNPPADSELGFKQLKTDKLEPAVVLANEMAEYLHTFLHIMLDPRSVPCSGSMQVDLAVGDFVVLHPLRFVVFP